MAALLRWLASLGAAARRPVVGANARALSGPSIVVLFVVCAKRLVQCRQQGDAACDRLEMDVASPDGVASQLRHQCPSIERLADQDEVLGIVRSFSQHVRRERLDEDAMFTEV